MSTTQETPVLIDGMRMSREEFLRRWYALPDVKNAELINGVVRMASPVSADHGDIDSWLSFWLGVYAFATPGVRASTNATWLMGDEDAPQPDQSLRVLPEYGGASSLDRKLLSGVPGLAVEVALSSSDIDLGEKLELYREHGVAEYLVALAGDSQVRWHRLDGGAYRLLEPGDDGLLRSEAFPGLWLDAAALFGEDAGRFQSVAREGVGSAEHGSFVERLRQAKNG